MKGEESAFFGGISLFFDSYHSYTTNANLFLFYNPTTTLITRVKFIPLLVGTILSNEIQTHRSGKVAPMANLPVMPISVCCVIISSSNIQQKITLYTLVKISLLDFPNDSPDSYSF